MLKPISRAFEEKSIASPTCFKMYRYWSKQATISSPYLANCGIPLMAASHSYRNLVPDWNLGDDKRSIVVLELGL